MNTSGRKINLNKISHNAYDAVLKLDTIFIGSEDYMGIASFWNYKYRHSLRDADISTRVKIHKAIGDRGVSPYGCTELHDEIVNKYTGFDYTQDAEQVERLQNKPEVMKQEILDIFQDVLSRQK